MIRPVVVLAQAQSDVREIVSWLRQRSPEGADAWFRAWERMLEQLSRVASSCVRAPEDANRDIDIFQMMFKTRRGRPYRALLTIQDDVVYVMHVRGPRQNLMSADDIVPPDECTSDASSGD